MLHLVVEEVTAKLEIRSKQRRQRYLQRLQESLARPPREHLGCSNLAHALAAQPHDQRLIMKQGGSPHIAIISSYNDLLSAHQPLQDYPQQLKQALAKVDQMVTQQAFMLAANDIFWASSMLFLLLIPLVWLAKGPSGQGGGSEAASAAH